MDLSRQNEKNPLASLARYQAYLHHADIVPEGCYRRNSLYYQLIAYISIITGLMHSKNYDVVPIFIRRAYRHMERRPALPEHGSYYLLVSKYLKQVTYVLVHYTSVDQKGLGYLIPAEILEAGEQEFPEEMIGHL